MAPLPAPGFHEAKMENDAVKRRREEEEKIAKQQQEVRLKKYLVGLGRSLKFRNHERRYTY